MGSVREAPGGFEPPNGGFADLCLTTWLRRQGRKARRTDGPEQAGATAAPPWPASVGRVAAQAPGRFPPDSLVNTQVIPRTTPVVEVIGAMRDFTFSLGVRCQFCHVGEEGLPLERFDFASDQKRTKVVARQMMRMVQEINRRVDTLPGRTASGIAVTCRTCHRGVSRPAPLETILQEAATAGGADSAIRAYGVLRDRYYG